MHDADSDLVQRVQQALIRSEFVDSRWVRPEVRDGVVTLTGTLPTYYQKQMAQEHLRRVEGVDQIYNDIMVQRRRQTEVGSQEPFVNEWTIEPATAPQEPTGARRVDTEPAGMLR